MAGWLVIYNPRAGSFCETRLGEICSVLEAEGLRVRCKATAGPGHGQELAREVRGADVVAAYGGDGTLNEVANGLLGRGIPLAFLPGGTANVMAWELGLPQDPKRAARLLAHGSIRPVQPGMLGERCFLLWAGFGFDGAAVKGVRPAVKARLGKGAYLLSGVKTLLGAPARLEVREGETLLPGAPLAWVVVARSRRYGGRFVVHPQAGLEAAALGLVRVWQPLPFLLGRLAWGLPLGGGLSLLGAQGCQIQTEAGVHVQVDGEYYGRGTSFRVGLAPQELPLCFPSQVSSPHNPSPHNEPSGDI